MILIADILIYTMAILLIVALLAVITCKMRSLSKNRTPRIDNGINVRVITISVATVALAILLLSFFAMPVDNIHVNGKAFSDTIWIRIANMCVVSASLLLFIATLAVLFGKLMNRRTKPQQNK